MLHSMKATIIFNLIVVGCSVTSASDDTRAIDGKSSREVHTTSEGQATRLRRIPYRVLSPSGDSIAYQEPSRGQFPSLCRVHRVSTGEPLWVGINMYSPLSFLRDGGKTLIVLPPSTASTQKNDNPTCVTFVRAGTSYLQYTLDELRGKGSWQASTVEKPPNVPPGDPTEHATTDALTTLQSKITSDSKDSLPDTHGPQVGFSQDFPWLSHITLSDNENLLSLTLEDKTTVTIDMASGKIVKRERAHPDPSDNHTRIRVSTYYADAIATRQIANRSTKLALQLCLGALSDEKNTAPQNHVTCPFGATQILTVLILAAGRDSADEIHEIGSVDINMDTQNRLRSALSSLQQHRPSSLSHYLGITIRRTPTSDPSLVVTDVTEQSRLTGLVETGAHIVSVNGKPVSSAVEFDAVSWRHRDLTIAVRHNDGSVRDIYVPTASSDIKPLASKLVVWRDEQTSLRPQFVRRMKADKFAELRTIQFSDAIAAPQINRYLSQFFGTQLRYPFANEQLNNASMLVTYLFSLDAQWVTPFTLGSTNPEGDFHTLQGQTVVVPMMHGDITVPFYYETDARVSLVDLPYRGNQLSLVLIIPDDSASIVHLEQVLADGLLTSWTRALDEQPPQELTLSLPRFSIRSLFSLKKALRERGVRQLFQATNDGLIGAFSQGGMYISDITQQSEIRVGESGTRATSVTSATIDSFGLARRRVVMADKPFLFCVRDRSTGLVVLWGRLCDPTAQ